MSSALDRFAITSSRSAERLVTVYIPDSASRGLGRLPLLLLHDGQNLFDPGRAHVPGQHWRVAETADALIAAGRIPPILIAGVDHLGPARVREFAPTAGDRHLGGGLAEYGRFLLDDLVPRLAQDYDARTDFDGLGMGGSSLGGLATLAVARQFPGRLGRLLIMSPSVWWDDRVMLRRLRRAGLRPPPRVWLDIGQGEGPRALTDTRALRDELRKQVSELRYEEDPQGDHSETAWGRRLGDALEWLYSDTTVSRT